MFLACKLPGAQNAYVPVKLDSSYAVCRDYYVVNGVDHGTPFKGGKPVSRTAEVEKNAVPARRTTQVDEGNRSSPPPLPRFV